MAARGQAKSETAGLGAGLVADVVQMSGLSEQDARAIVLLVLERARDDLKKAADLIGSIDLSLGARTAAGRIGAAVDRISQQHRRD